MALTINTNMASIKTERAVALNRGQMETTMQRLASGKRINSALDDASGLAVANRMRNQIDGLNMAIRNANDGISMSQTAEGSMEELSNVLQRMRELAVQSSNGTYTAEDRSYIAAEFDELMKEMRRVSTQAAWDGDVKLIDEGAKPMQVQVGVNAADYIQVPLQSLTIEDLKMATRVNVNAYSGSAIDSFSFKETGGGIVDAANGIPRTEIKDGQNKIVDVRFDGSITDGSGNVTLYDLPNFELKLWSGARDSAGNPDGVSTVTLSAVAVTSVKDLIDQLKAHPKYDSTAVDLQFEAGELKVVWKIAGAPSPSTSLIATNVNDSGDKRVTVTAETAAAAVSRVVGGSLTPTAKTGTDFDGSADPKFWSQKFDLSNLTFHKDTLPKTAGNNFELQIGSRVLKADNVTDVSDLVNKFKADSDYEFILSENGFPKNYDMFDIQDAGPLITPRTQIMTVKFGEFANSRAFLRQSVNNVTIADPNSAITALDYVDQAAKVVNESRARMGAVMSRIEYTINNLMNLVENTEEAKSRVLDTDYAKESANLAKAQVLAQAGTAMLAQANQSQQYVLNLLRQS